NKAQQDFGAYIASINLGSGKTWPYRLQTQPRPTGKSTQAIITTYDLPDDAAPHDTLLDKEGNVWFTDFQHQFISKLDPKTGKVSTYLAPGWKKDDTRFTMIDALHSNVDGKLWTKANEGDANRMYQFDLATKQFHEVLPPPGRQTVAGYGLVTDLDNNV